MFVLQILELNQGQVDRLLKESRNQPPQRRPESEERSK
jgi:hypothetical protein